MVRDVLRIDVSVRAPPDPAGRGHDEHADFKGKYATLNNCRFAGNQQTPRSKHTLLLVPRSMQDDGMA